ncbi:MAG: hypothetical protein WCQ99_02325 [Pseudomonadota bacterium]
MNLDDIECLSPKEVAKLIHKSVSFVYEHKELLGGFSAAGAVLFRVPVLRERILAMEQAASGKRPVTPTKRQIHPDLVGIKNHLPSWR